MTCFYSCKETINCPIVLVLWILSILNAGLLAFVCHLRMDNLFSWYLVSCHKMHFTQLPVLLLGNSLPLLVANSSVSLLSSSIAFPSLPTICGNNFWFVQEIYPSNAVQSVLPDLPVSVCLPASTAHERRKIWWENMLHLRQATTAVSSFLCRMFCRTIPKLKKITFLQICISCICSPFWEFAWQLTLYTKSHSLGAYFLLMVKI